MLRGLLHVAASGLPGARTLDRGLPGCVASCASWRLLPETVVASSPDGDAIRLLGWGCCDRLLPLQVGRPVGEFTGGGDVLGEVAQLDVVLL